MEFKNRKLNRLQNYDYSTNGIYFITVCSYNKMELFGDISNDNEIVLSGIGKTIDSNICILEKIYAGVRVHNYVIMPNHIHMLIELLNQEKDIPHIMSLFKSTVSKLSGFSVWQKSYHDRIVRNFKEYQAFDCYINDNPNRWLKDCYYTHN